MGFDFAGTYTRTVPYQRIVYAFGGRSAEVIFTPGSGGVAVRVTFDAESTHPIARQRHGWQAILDGFKRFVEARQRSP